MDKKSLPELSLCVALDAIGCASYLLPFLGEFTDVVWAPVSGIIFYNLFGKKMGLFGGVFSFVEELLPGFDIIPTFTIAWFMRKREMEKPNLNLKQLKIIK